MLDVLQRIRVVLVNTSHPGNIGGAARAMKNMGICDFYLVDPRDYPSGKAYARSANANDVLENATVVASLSEALVGCGLVVGASARERGIPWPMLNARECGEKVVGEARQHDVALVFGREDSGLSNEELQLCTYHVHIATNPECSSLNLAAAVQVICYEVRMAALQAENGKLPDLNQWDLPPAKHDDLEMYYQHLEQAMIDIEFHNPDNPRQTMARLRRLYGRVRLDRMELSILRGLLTSIQRVARQLKSVQKKQ